MGAIFAAIWKVQWTPNYTDAKVERSQMDNVNYRRAQMSGDKSN